MWRCNHCQLRQRASNVLQTEETRFDRRRHAHQYRGDFGGLEGPFRTKVATNGEKALAIATAAEKPDLILLDVMMPGMDGYEVCRRLKDIPATRDIPIIFLTAKTDEVEEEKGFDVGAVDYIHKPFSAPIVLARIRTQLALREALIEAQERASTQTNCCMRSSR